MLSTGRIPALHREHLWLPHSNVCSVDLPQRSQKPLNAELDVYAVKSQNEHQFPERGALIYRKVALGAQGATKKRGKKNWV